MSIMEYTLIKETLFKSTTQQRNFITWGQRSRRRDVSCHPVFLGSRTIFPGPEGFGCTDIKTGSWSVPPFKGRGCSVFGHWLWSYEFQFPDLLRICHPDPITKTVVSPSTSIQQGNGRTLEPGRWLGWLWGKKVHTLPRLLPWEE